MASTLVLNRPIELVMLATREDFEPRYLNRVEIGDGWDLEIVVQGDKWHGQTDDTIAGFLHEFQYDLYRLNSIISKGLDARAVALPELAVDVKVTTGQSSIIRIPLRTVITVLLSSAAAGAAAAGQLQISIPLIAALCGSELYFGHMERIEKNFCHQRRLR